MTSEAPEFHTKPSTPLSPLPVHPPEPSRLPVLRNQIDPVFNMTATHSGMSDGNTSHDTPVVPSADDAVADPSHDSSFSDAYDDEDHDEAEIETIEKQTIKASDPDDDYAMTFDSDGEGNADKAAEVDSPTEPASSINPLHEKTSTAISINETLSGINTTLETTFAPDLPTTISHETFGEKASTSNDGSVGPGPTNVASPQAEINTYEEIASGEVDIQQLLDNITAKAELKTPIETTTSPISAAQAFTAPPSNLPAHSSLPPRPHSVQNGLPFPSFSAHDAARASYMGASSLPPPPGIGVFRAPGVSGLAAPGAPGTAPPTLLPPPPSSMFPTPPGVAAPPIPPLHFLPKSQNSTGNSRQDSKKERSDGVDLGEVQWSSTVQKHYEEFLDDERGYVLDGQWDKFPAGSRLFIGNLPTEKVTKRDIFSVFYQYGKLAQISIKQAYGFVQFLRTDSCYVALDREQGALLRGRKMHLEISKPQKNTRQSNNNSNNGTNQRARSPDNIRGQDRQGGRGGQQASQHGHGHHESGSQGGRRNDNFGNALRGRDEYRPGFRSPSPPPRGGVRGRDEYQNRGGRDSYRRSRSMSPPYDRRDSGRYRNRSPSPRSREADEDADLPLPRRNPRDIPDVFIILVDELDRAFVSWVEGEIRSRNLKTEVMLLNSRLPLAAVIRRQILEGVHAVIQLTRRSQDASKIPLQVFDRQGGADNVRFDEYQDLEPKIAAELVLRTKQTESTPAYNQQQFSQNQTYQSPASRGPAAPLDNLANLVGNLDNAALQQLLGTLGNQPQHAQHPSGAPSNTQIDLAGILGGLAKQNQQPKQAYQPPPQQNYQQPPQQNSGYGPAGGNSGLVNLLGNGAAPPAQNQQSQQQVQNIMAQLARFRQ